MQKVATLTVSSLFGNNCVDFVIGLQRGGKFPVHFRKLSTNPLNIPKNPGHFLECFRQLVSCYDKINRLMVIEDWVLIIASGFLQILTF